MYKDWICLQDQSPKEDFGILFKITQEKGKLFYGYYSSKTKKGYLYVTLSIVDEVQCTGMAWKVLKDYDKKDIYWFNDECKFPKDLAAPMF